MPIVRPWHETNLRLEASIARAFRVNFIAPLLLLATAIVFAQNSPVPSAPDKPTLKRFDVTEPETGVHSVRLLLSLPSTGNASRKDPPRFTVECLEDKGKHDMLWSVSFGDAPDPGFVTPFRPTKANLYPPTYPSVNLRMTFEGYIKSKPFIRSWSELPTRELRYRNPGLGSPNMESARWFLGFLNSLPGLRIVYAKRGPADAGEAYFPTQDLLAELNKTPACSQ